METKIYNQEGKPAGTIKLPENIFGAKWNADLVHQVVTGIETNMRSGTSHSKGRGEVRGGGKKPWQQKGTGRARHGSRRSPIWKGGGSTHGPSNERNYMKKLNYKMKAKALFALLSQKYKKGEIIFVDEIKLSENKTKLAGSVISSLSKVSGFTTLNTKKKNNVYLTTPKRDASIVKSFRNLSNTEIGNAQELNPVDLSTHRYIVLVNPKESIEVLEKKMK